jgi:hypothetical protein
MTDTPTASLPSLADAQAWIGFRLDEMGGHSVARVQAIYVDAESGQPVWVVAKLGRFGRTTAVPFAHCAAGAGHLWCAYDRDTIKGAPAIEPGLPLTREQELVLCAHFGMSEGQARAGEIGGRAEGKVTAKPPELAA